MHSMLLLFQSPVEGFLVIDNYLFLSPQKTWCYQNGENQADRLEYLYVLKYWTLYICILLNCTLSYRQIYMFEDPIATESMHLHRVPYIASLVPRPKNCQSSQGRVGGSDFCQNWNKKTCFHRTTLKAPLYTVSAPVLASSNSQPLGVHLILRIEKLFRWKTIVSLTNPPALKCFSKFLSGNAQSEISREEL